MTCTVRIKGVARERGWALVRTDDPNRYVSLLVIVVMVVIRCII